MRMLVLSLMSPTIESMTIESLSEATVTQYREKGYCVLEDVIPSEALDAAVHSLDQERASAALHQTDRYNEAGRVDFRKVSNLAKKSAAFRSLACNPVIVSAVEALLGQRALLFRDVLVVKPARDGAALDFHQDSQYWDVAPRALISAWFTFRDVATHDGCLKVIAGSHLKTYPHDLLLPSGRALPSALTAALRMMVSFAGTGDSDASGFSGARKLKNSLLGNLTRHASFLAKLQDLHARVSQEEKSCAIDLPVKAGSVILFHSMLLHASNPNTSNLDRPAYIASYMGDQYTFCGLGDPEFLVAAERDTKVLRKIKLAGR
jgi:ectoine hydroxylase-related dioxygenase (phytanoyl-CoA dioxygenase family)